jgi:starch phosphorylase
VYYFSLEFLVGRMLFDALSNLGLAATAIAALDELGVDFERIRRLEPDPGARQRRPRAAAACFMESMAALSIPAHGYGIRYDHGIFRQVVRDGWQQEMPEEWLTYGNPGNSSGRGHVHRRIRRRGRRQRRAQPLGTRRNRRRGRLRHADRRLARTSRQHAAVVVRARHRPLSLLDFNRGDHVGALADRVRLEAISRVLYPSDETAAGQDLRLRPGVLLRLRVAAGPAAPSSGAAVSHGIAARPRRDPAQRYASRDRRAGAHAAPGRRARRRVGDRVEHRHARLQLHQSHAVARGARDVAGAAARRAPAAPHADHRAHQRAAPRRPARSGVGDGGLLSSLSVFDEAGERRVRMGHLAFLGAHRVNGVSALHTGLMRETVFRDLHAGSSATRSSTRPTASRSAAGCSRRTARFSRFSSRSSGRRCRTIPTRCVRWMPLAGDAAFREAFARQRRTAKDALAALVAERTGVEIDPSALFDVHVKRIHEYKRQLLNVLQTVAAYLALRDAPEHDAVPRVKIFSGKAAAGYRQAKLVIKLIHDVARVINADPAVRGRLAVAFLPNYNVSLAESIIPAADLSEQISTAGMEASGTGNMKLALNGAVTIGTLDGANIEIRERVGADNFVLFGLTAAEAAARRAQGLDMAAAIAQSPPLARALEAIASGMFSPDDPARFSGLAESLRRNDTSWCARISRATSDAQARVDSLGATPRRGGAPPSPTPPTSGSSPRTARSANTRARCGDCRKAAADAGRASPTPRRSRAPRWPTCSPAAAARASWSSPTTAPSPRCISAARRASSTSRCRTRSIPGFAASRSPRNTRRTA